MPAPSKGKRLGGSPAHQRLILANLATSLFENGAITTTEAKARRLRPFAERLITKARRGNLHNRRQVMAVIRDKTVVHTLFTEIGPRYAERPGGYTRITKIGPRQGDNAPMAVIELVTEEYQPKQRAQTGQAQAQPAPQPAGPAEPAGAEAEPAGVEAESGEAGSGEADQAGQAEPAADEEEPAEAASGEADHAGQADPAADVTESAGETEPRSQ